MKYEIIIQQLKNGDTKMDEYMDNLLRFVGGVIVIICTVAYMLACAFAPFGIVWLVLTH